MRVLCYGDRNWSDMRIIERELRAFPAGTVIMHGDCVGVDKMVGVASKVLNLEVNVIPLVRGVVGPLRNQQFLDEGKPDEVLIFHPDAISHRGSYHLYHLARDHNIPVRIITA